MKMITAVIKPFKLDDLRDALAGIGVNGMTVSDVRGYGRQKGKKELYHGAEYSVSFLPKVKVEVAVSEDKADEAVDAIYKAAHTGRVGDGKIFVYELDKVIRIRTGESDEDAL